MGRSMNRQQREFNDQVKSTIPEADKQITHIKAKMISYDAEKALGFAPLDVEFVFKKKIIHKGWYSSEQFGRAEHGAGRERWITLWEGGQTLGTLLHEIAHMMPFGGGHEINWQRNFLKLAKWWIEKGVKIDHGKFA
jgi:hypothetical protein